MKCETPLSINSTSCPLRTCKDALMNCLADDSIQCQGKRVGDDTVEMGEAVQVVLQLLPLQGLGRSLDSVACAEGRYLLAASPLPCGVPASPVERMASDRKCGVCVGAHGLLGSWQPSTAMPLGCAGDAKSAVAVLDNCAGRREAKLMKSRPCCLLGAVLV